LAGIVAQPRDLDAVLASDGERFQDVVHVGGFEIETRGFAGGESAAALEVADAAFVKDYFADGNVSGHSRREKNGQQRKRSSHNAPNQKCPYACIPFKLSSLTFHSPITLIMTRLGRWPSNSA